MDKQKKLYDLMKGFSSAMLVTKSDNGMLDARPMAIADISDAGELWFVTHRDSGKVADLEGASEVAVTMQGSRQFLSVSGNAHLVDDRAKIQSLWNEAWKIWFPEGKRIHRLR